MHNFTTWATREVPVTELRLDPINPRLAPTSKLREVREIVAELVQHEGVYELARDIADKGYFPTEILVGVEEDGERIVIEGNRRLSALKLLLSPTLAPQAAVKKFHALHARVDPKLIRTVPVLFAPSRELAAPLIVARHTQNGVAKWEPTQQGRYLRSLARNDVSIEDLARLTGMERSSLAHILRVDALYQIACELELPEAERTTVLDPRQFNFSTFERLMESSRVQELLGLTYDEAMSPKISVKTEEFTKAFKRMVSDVARGVENTRTLNNAKDIERYLGELGSDTPDSTPVEPHDPGSKPPQPSPPPKTPNKRSGPKTPALTSSLVPKGFRSRLRHPRINAAFEELRHLKVASFPNATAVMLRIVLEMLVSNYLDVTGKIQPLLDIMKKKGKGADFYPSLRQMLNQLVNEDPDAIAAIPPQQLRRLRKMVSQDDHPLSLDELDQFVHNRHTAPTEAHLRTFWGQLEPLIDMLLNEPAKPTPSPKPAKGKP